jgi:hypothetical protein
MPAGAGWVRAEATYIVATCALPNDALKLVASGEKEDKGGLSEILAVAPSRRGFISEQTVRKIVGTEIRCLAFSVRGLMEC